MTKDLYTPAPWFASPVQTDDYGFGLCTVGPFDVRGRPLEDHVEDTICTVSGINYSDVLEGNARLIAASPRLLDALNGLVGLIQLIDTREPDLKTNHRFVEALAALAEAEGR